MSKKYIDADALIMGLRNRAKEEWSQKTTTRWETAYDEVADEIDELAAADVRENVRGEWKHDKDDSLISGYCSNCGWESIIMETDVADMDYCPNCGAYMRGDQNETD